MKKIFTYILVGFLVLSAISLDVSAAKKSSKISKEEMAEMSENIDKITQKIYGRALLSPQDNETLIGIKIKLDNQMLVSPTPELAPLYFKAGNIYRLRDMKSEAIECYQTVLENFADTALAPKATAVLEDLGVNIDKPTEENPEEVNKEEKKDTDDGI